VRVALVFATARVALGRKDAELAHQSHQIGSPQCSVTWLATDDPADVEHFDASRASGRRNSEPLPTIGAGYDDPYPDLVRLGCHYWLVPSLLPHTIRYCTAYVVSLTLQIPARESSVY
jgi:hypothetical protein